jgi:hypothetical protein
MASGRSISKTSLASALGMHRDTLAKRLKEQGLDRKFDELTNDELDILTRNFKAKKPTSGLRYLRGSLRKQGVRIQKDRVRKSLTRVDALGQALRTRLAIKRRRYKVPRPNYLWHGDGHHKLIWWGIVLHGFIDGYCRTVCLSSCRRARLIMLIQVTGLRASTNNRAQTVLEVFLMAIQEYGTPSRVRGDRGGENTKVSIWMIMHRGPGRASFMWGS